MIVRIDVKIEKQQSTAWMSLKALTIGSTVLLTMLSAPNAAADDRSTVPMPGVFKRCDFTANTFVPANGDGRALALVGHSGPGTVSADVQLFTAQPDTQYTVRLIQTPRTSLNCTANDPGVTAAFMNTDGLGAATVTLQAPTVPGATGAWVFIDRPSEYSQTPVEFYTSDFIARS